MRRLFNTHYFAFLGLLFILLFIWGCCPPPQQIHRQENNEQQPMPLQINATEHTDSAIAYNSFLYSQEIEGYDADNLVYMPVNKGFSLHFNNVHFIPEFTDTNIGSVLIDSETNSLCLSLEINSSFVPSMGMRRLLTYSVDLNKGILLDKELYIPALPKAYAGLAEITDQRFVEIAEEFSYILKKVADTPEEDDPYQAVRNELGQKFGVKIRKASEEEITDVGLSPDDIAELSPTEYYDSLYKDIVANNIANLKAKGLSLENSTVTIPIENQNLSFASFEPARFAQKSDNCSLYINGEVFVDTQTNSMYWCWIENARSLPEGHLPWFISKDYYVEYINTKSCRVYYKGVLLTKTGDILEDSYRAAIFTIE